MILESLPKISQYSISEICHFTTKVLACISYTLKDVSAQKFCILMHNGEFESLVYCGEEK